MITSRKQLKTQRISRKKYSINVDYEADHNCPIQIYNKCSDWWNSITFSTGKQLLKDLKIIYGD